MMQTIGMCNSRKTYKGILITSLFHGFKLLCIPNGTDDLHSSSFLVMTFYVDDYEEMHTLVNPTSLLKIGHHLKNKICRERLIVAFTLCGIQCISNMKKSAT